MGAERNAVKCLDCDQVLTPNDEWQACTCGHLYMDGSGPEFRLGFLSEDRVETVGESKSQARRKKVQKSGDQWTDSETGF